MERTKVSGAGAGAASCVPTLVANHYYSRAGLLRRVELSTALAAAGVTGRGLHSFTSQLNLSRV